MREALARRKGGEEDLRWRGEDVSRLVAFTDADFAFAVTLLVVSLEVPKSFDELLVDMRGFFAFAIEHTDRSGSRRQGAVKNKAARRSTPFDRHPDWYDNTLG